MRLVRLYSNQPNIFSPIAFNEGLSVVLAEIRRDQGKRKTVHNLGKSTVARLIDFCLLKGRHSSFFLFKHEDIFANFTGGGVPSRAALNKHQVSESGCLG